MARAMINLIAHLTLHVMQTCGSITGVRACGYPMLEPPTCCFIFFEDYATSTRHLYNLIFYNLCENFIYIFYKSRSIYVKSSEKFGHCFHLRGKYVGKERAIFRMTKFNTKESFNEYKIT
ncbi:hypothetical protein PUN28_010783 [Cardiocondyla obscurior]|uniref:Uncharacterized protein n=1 Tax=Cardiocondyla obscurior TaxID=286306 RepID=A0AAW2FK94_9HYME